jgi:dipeptidyl aminopeptidase
VFDLGAYQADSDDGLSPVAVPQPLSWPNRLPLNISIINEVAWVGEGRLVVKEVERSAETGVGVLWDLTQSGTLTARADLGLEERQAGKGTQFEGTITRTLGKHGEEADEGWIDNVGLFLLFSRFGLAILSPTNCGEVLFLSVPSSF